MKQILIGIAVITAFASCNHDKKIIVSATYVDSLLTHYTEPAAIKTNAEELKFWKNRMDLQPAGIVNELKYASLLTGRFQLTGDINDVLSADSILKVVDLNLNAYFL